MPFRPAERVREPAVPMQPLVDPASWRPEELAASEDWIYELSDAEADEVRDTVEAVQRRGIDILDITRDDFPLPRLDEGLHALYDELLEGRGFVLIRGLPVAAFDKTQAGIAFWGIGTRFGRALSQNPKGHMLGHVKDFGGDYNDPQVRGYQTSAEMAFHSDQCDYVALLCVQPAKSGGASRIASTVTLYNEMLKACPDLVRELIAEFYLTKHGESAPGDCLAAFTAASLAGGRLMRTGLESLKLGAVVFFVSFLFVFSPALLLQSDNYLLSGWALATGIVGCLFLAAAFEGYLVGVLGAGLRIICGFVGASLLLPAGLRIADIPGVYTDAAGIVLGVPLFAWIWMRGRRPREVEGRAPRPAGRRPADNRVGTSDERLCAVRPTLNQIVDT